MTFMGVLVEAARFMFSGFWEFIAVLLVLCIVFRWLTNMIYAIRGVPRTVKVKVNPDGTPYVEKDEDGKVDDDEVSVKVEF